MCMGNLACVCVCTPHVTVPARTSRGCHIPQHGVTNGCEPSWSCWESNLGPLGEQLVLCTELSLQPCARLLFLYPSPPRLLWSHRPPFTPTLSTYCFRFGLLKFCLGFHLHAPKMGLTYNHWAFMTCRTRVVGDNSLLKLSSDLHLVLHH